MTKFEPCVIPRSEVDRMIGELLFHWATVGSPVRVAFNCTVELAPTLIRAYVLDMASQPVFKNNRYQVAIRQLPDGFDHLSIRRLDRKPIHDWRDLQKIKNELVGPNCEAVELYPAEARRVDTANQYHLWVCRDANFRFPLGFNAGRHCTEGTLFSSVQRPFEK